MLSLIIITLSRPIINNGKIEVEISTKNLVVAFDISYSMNASDIYPDRFSFAKQKFYSLMENFKDASFGIQVFSNQSYLISPISKDIGSLKYLVENISLEYVSRNGTSIMSALEVANELQEDEKQKNILIFSDGGNNTTFEDEITYAKENNIKVYMYMTASKKGAPIKNEKNEFIKDEKGNLVITKLNSNIKKLALKSGGAYLEYSLNKNDIKTLINEIKDNAKSKSKKSSLMDVKELFYYPLILAFFIFLLINIQVKFHFKK